MGEKLRFDGSKSSHAVSWHWEFGDNTSSDEAVVEHTLRSAREAFREVASGGPPKV